MKLPSVAIYAFAAIALLTGESEARLGAHRRLGHWGFSGHPRGSGGFAGNGMTVPFADELDNEDVGGHWGFSGNPRGSGGFAGNGVTNPIQVRL